jgi:hypothetical protein
MLACATSLLAVAACGTQNSTNTLTGAGDEPLPALVANPPSSIPAEAAPSVDGLDRRNWPVTAVAVPRGQVEVQPSYSENLSLASGPTRDDGAYPTAATALDGRSDGLSVLAEAGAQPFWSAGWVMVGGPIRMAIGQPPWTVQQNPTPDLGLKGSSDRCIGAAHACPRDSRWHHPRHRAALHCDAHTCASARRAVALSNCCKARLS